MKIVIEKMEKCSLVKENSYVDGHDCWGNYEHSSYKYVLLNGKEERVHKGNLHDGKKVLKVTLLELMPDYMQEFLDKDFAKKSKDKRKKTYLKLKKEFENEDKNSK